MGNFESHSGRVLGLDLDALDIDKAYVFFRNDLPDVPAYFYSLTDQCAGCLPEIEYPTAVQDEVVGVISTEYGVDLFAGLDTARSNLTRCSNSGSFSEFGIYNCTAFSMNTTDAELLKCHCVDAKPGANIYWPILCCCLFYFGLAVVWIATKFLWRKYGRRAYEADSEYANRENAAGLSANKQVSAVSLPATEEAFKQTKPKRIKSIDTFRGIAMSVMIFVNYGGGDYWFFDHSPWNGLGVADLVFPWFMWLMGICIPISMRSLLRRETSKPRAFVKIIKRSIWLFVLGLCLSNAFIRVDVQTLRFGGVLQRFGITYLIIASLHLALLKPDRVSSSKKIGFIKEFVDILPEWLIVLMVVTLHLMVTLMPKLEGCPRGYLGPGGRHDSGLFMNCTGGVTGYIDRTVFGANHLFQHATLKSVYDSPLPYDPEGIMGTLQALFTVFLGVQAGMIIVTYKNHKERIVRWLLWAVITGVIGAVLCKCSRDDGWIPVNKNLWSVSFVLVTASLAFMVLTVCYFLIDVVQFWTGAPFFYSGMNSILLYVGHQLTFEMFPWRWADSGSGSAVVTHGYQLVVDLWGATLWVIISVWLYKIKFFLAL